MKIENTFNKVFALYVNGGGCCTMIAVKSNVAFAYIEIAISGAEVNVRNKGFAIANIRVAD